MVGVGDGGPEDLVDWVVWFDGRSMDAALEWVADKRGEWR